MKRNRDAYIHRLNKIYYGNLEKDKVDVVSGRASFIGNKELVVDGNRDLIYSAPHILVATGGRPVDMKRMVTGGGGEFCIDSDLFFELKELPRKVMVLGAGYIAVEMAGMLKSLGSDVTLMVRHDRPLRTFDETISGVLLDEMRRTGINVVTESTCSKIEPEHLLEYKDRAELKSRLTAANLNELSFTVHAANTNDPNNEKRTYKGFNCILAAVGREPITDDLHLAENTDVKLKDDSLVEVD